MSKTASANPQTKASVETFRKPNLEDGSEVWKLIKKTKVLDLNSSYSYLLWCSYFKDTSIVIEVENKIVGFISGFVKPTSPDRLFIWQVAVDESERGRGFASKMLHGLLERESCKDIRYLETTVSPSNIPSKKLFHGLARDLKAEIDNTEFFTAEDFPEKGHEDEILYQIGPF